MVIKNPATATSPVREFATGRGPLRGLLPESTLELL